MFIFASDLHLCPARPGTVHLFERFLESLAQRTDVEALYLLGDLFEYWAGDDDLADPFNARICAAIQKVGAGDTPHSKSPGGTARSKSPGGMAIFFLPGNRDFLVGERFCAATGARLLPDEVVVDLAGTKTLLLHGDTLCTDDIEYQRFRALVRSPLWQRDFLALPLAERRAQIEALRAKSEQEKSGKPYAIMDVNAAAVARILHAHGVTRVIHGHTHRRARHDVGGVGRPAERWVLGDWGATGNALACDADGCHWQEWTP